MRVAVLGAGGPAGVSALRALAHAGHECIAADANESHLVWCNEFAETHHMPFLTPKGVNKLEADVVLPQPDPLVRWVVEHRGQLAAKTLLPRISTVLECQNKARTALQWYFDALREYPPVELEPPWPDNLHLARERYGLPLWLRATRGAGARGAILVRSLDQAYHWIRFWQSRDSDMEWMCEEYLPGRDFAFSSIYYQGELITSFARERLEYLYPHLTPEGLTGTPTVARIVYDDDVNAVADVAVRSIDQEPHGIYSVDLRQDAEGYPRPTEINAGRGFTTFGLWSMYGLNFLDLVVKLAAGDAVHLVPAFNALPEGLTLSRHIDCKATFTKSHAPLTLCA